MAQYYTLALSTRARAPNNDSSSTSAFIALIRLKVEAFFAKEPFPISRSSSWANRIGLFSFVGAIVSRCWTDSKDFVRR